MKWLGASTRTCEDLARRGVAGLWAHPVGLLILAIATPVGVDHPQYVWPMILLALVFSVFRGYIQFRLLTGRCTCSPTTYFAGHGVAMLLAGFGWSILSVIIIPSYGVRHWITCLLLINVAGIAAGGLTATAPSLFLMRVYTLAIWLGPLYCLAAAGTEGWPLLTVIALYNGFLHAQGGRVHREYVRGVEREAELEEATRTAQASNAAKDRFLANMSHEIRTPMNGVLGSLALTLDEEHHDPLDPERRALLRVAKDSAESLQRLLDDILDLSKIEAGHIHVERVAFDLPALCASVGNLLRATAQQKGVELAVEIEPSVPTAVLGDPTRLRQVLSNLIGNAVKFTEQGSVRLEVSRQGSQVAFAVRDTGIGIPRDKQEHIFEAFVQADAGTTRRFGGTGLGLAISRHLVRLMGGELLLDSEEGLGSCFSFRLDLPATQSPAATPLSPTNSNALPALRILLAEDTAVNQRVITAMLQRLGQQVVIAADGRQACQAAESGSFDLILMDIQMPEMNGLEATRALRQANCRTPIYGISANAFASDRQQGLAAGMDGYLTKPVAQADLRNLLASLAPPPSSVDQPVLDRRR